MSTIISFVEIVSIWRPSAVLHLFCASLDDTRRVFGGFYHATPYLLSSGVRLSIRPSQAGVGCCVERNGRNKLGFGMEASFHHFHSVL